MSIDGNIDYALTRVHARQALLADEVTWRRIESSRDLPHYVGALRATTLQDWVATIDLGHDVHAIERVLRAQWRTYVADVAAWHPREWQPWLEWLAWLSGLSLLARLARPEPAPAWLLADPIYGPAAVGSPAERAAALTPTALAPLAPAILAHTSILEAWQRHWQQLLPRSDAHTRQMLDALLAILREHAQAMRMATQSGDAIRAELARRLARLLRLAAGTIVVTVCHLALQALQLERLRGGLARRRAFTVAADVVR